MRIDKHTIDESAVTKTIMTGTGMTQTIIAAGLHRIRLRNK